MIIQLKQGVITDRKEVDLSQDKTSWVDTLIERGIELFICGGIERELESLLVSNGIKVIGNVAGEVDDVLSALLENRLHPWFGYKQIERSPASDDGNEAVTDKSQLKKKTESGEPLFYYNCLECETRNCQTGQGCTAFDPATIGETNRLSSVTWAHSYFLTSLTGGPIARMEDLGTYCQTLNCKQVSIVFCSAVFSDMEWILKQLNVPVQALPICCCFGNRRMDRVVASDEPVCNPDKFATILNNSDSDLIVTIGPCLEFSTSLEYACRAPVITSTGKIQRSGESLFPVTNDCAKRKAWREVHCMSGGINDNQ